MTERERKRKEGKRRVKKSKREMEIHLIFFICLLSLYIRLSEVILVFYLLCISDRSYPETKRRLEGGKNVEYRVKKCWPWHGG